VKKLLIALSVGSSIAMAAVSVPAHAQANKQSGQQPSAQSQGQQANNPAMKGRRAVIGTVTETREIQLKGINAKHRLVKIRNKEGQNLVINVGDATRTPAGQFKKGSRIVAIGKEARINGKPVLYAKYIGDLREVGSMGKRSR
jgi:hypothetical protein